MEGWPLLRVLGPAALHQLPQFLQVTLQGQGGPEGGLFAPSHTLDDLCVVGEERPRGRFSLGPVEKRGGGSRTRARGREALQGTGLVMLRVIGSSGAKGGGISRVPSLWSWG